MNEKLTPWWVAEGLGKYAMTDELLALRAENERLREEACGGKMSDIGDAIQELREGGQVRRAGWEGKWLELEGLVILLKSDDGASRGWLGDHDDSVVTDDLLADDWEAAH